MQGRFLVLGLVSEAVLPGEAQHVFDRVVDAQSAGVVERRAALVVFAAQQCLDAAILRLETP